MDFAVGGMIFAVNLPEGWVMVKVFDKIGNNVG